MLGPWGSSGGNREIVGGVREWGACGWGHFPDSHRRMTGYDIIVPLASRRHPVDRAHLWGALVGVGVGRGLGEGLDGKREWGD